MARPIKETPILFGEDARRFEERMRQRRTVPKEEIERVLKHYRIGMRMLKKGKDKHYWRLATSWNAKTTERQRPTLVWRTTAFR